MANTADSNKIPKAPHTSSKTDLEEHILYDLDAIFIPTIHHVIEMNAAFQKYQKSHEQMMEIAKYIATTPILKDMYANFLETDEQKAKFEEGKVDADHVAAHACHVLDRTITSLIETLAGNNPENWELSTVGEGITTTNIDDPGFYIADVKDKEGNKEEIKIQKSVPDNFKDAGVSNVDPIEVVPLAKKVTTGSYSREVPTEDVGLDDLTNGKKTTQTHLRSITTTTTSVEDSPLTQHIKTVNEEIEKSLKEKSPKEFHKNLRKKD